MIDINLKVYKTCSSTNDIALKEAQNGSSEGSSFLSYVQTAICHFSENLIVSKNLVSRHWWRQMSIATDKLMALQSIQHIQGQTKSFYIATPTQHT